MATERTTQRTTATDRNGAPMTKALWQTQGLTLPVDTLAGHKLVTPTQSGAGVLDTGFNGAGWSQAQPITSRGEHMIPWNELRHHRPELYGSTYPGDNLLAVWASDPLALGFGGNYIPTGLAGFDPEYFGGCHLAVPNTPEWPC